MNFLILGGLLLVAIAAIVGAIVLVASEQSAEKSRASTVIPGSTATSATTLPTATLPLIEGHQLQPQRAPEEYTPPAARQASATRTLPADEFTSPPARQVPPSSIAPVVRDTPSFYARSGEQEHFTLNGQFRELTTELRNLYQQASDLERRLQTLTEMAERIENTQSNRVGIEE